MISEQMKRCPKCNDVSGDDWSQCGGSCPMPESPHYATPKDPPMTIDPVELERLSKAATQGPEEYAAFVNALFDAYRTGQLVPAQPSGDGVEAVARAIMVAKGGKCLVKDWSIERRDNPHVALAWDQATAAITAYEAVSGVAKMREALKAVNDAEMPSSWEAAVDGLIEAARAALGEQP